MALVWNPTTFQYEDTATPSGVGTSALGGQLAGNILPQLGAGAQFQAAAGDVFGQGYADNPFARRAIQQQYNPLYGQYLMGYGGGGGSSGIGDGSFASWLRGGGGATPGTNQFGTGAIPMSQDNLSNWQNIIGTARAMDPRFGGGSVTAGSNIYNQYADMLQDPAMVRALTSAATYNPTLGSIYGGLRQRGIDRAQQAYQQTNPGATGADWLGYLAAGQGPTAGMVTAPGFTVAPTTGQGYGTLPAQQ